MRLRIPFPRSLSLLAAAALLSACGREEKAEVASQDERPQAQLDDARTQLASVEKGVAEKEAQLAAARSAIETLKIELAEKDQVIAQRDTQIAAAQKELDGLKKRDIFVFAEIRALEQQGATLTAANRYRQFLRDFPNSAFAPLASSAVTELNSENQREIGEAGDLFAPARQERQTLDYFRDGLLTPQELAPLLKRKSRNQVFAMLGRPNFNFPDGKEVGYNDKATNPATGRRGMLIITFESGEVSSLRVDYAGRPITP